MKLRNLKGQTFGRLTVLCQGPNAGNEVTWICQCECGNETKSRAGNLRNGVTRSCGCLHKETAADNGRKSSVPGLPTKHPRVYSTWRSMIRRCYDHSDPSYDRYGGRGIQVCDRWRDSLEFFIENMGPRLPGTTIERIENTGHYDPSNCKWATGREQSRNKRNNRLIEFCGCIMTLAAWAEETGLAHDVISKRLKAGWSVEKAISTPTRITRRRSEAR